MNTTERTEMPPEAGAKRRLEEEAPASGEGFQRKNNHARNLTTSAAKRFKTGQKQSGAPTHTTYLALDETLHDHADTPRSKNNDELILGGQQTTDSKDDIFADAPRSNGDDELLLGGLTPVLGEQGRPRRPGIVAIDTPTELDVLFIGRGKLIQSHPGNQRLMKIVQEHKQSYQEAPRRDLRRPIAQKVLRQIIVSGARFLKRVNEVESATADDEPVSIGSCIWEEEGPDAALDEVSQALQANTNKEPCQSNRRDNPAPTAAALNAPEVVAADEDGNNDAFSPLVVSSLGASVFEEDEGNNTSFQTIVPELLVGQDQTMNNEVGLAVAAAGIGEPQQQQALLTLIAALQQQQQQQQQEIRAAALDSSLDSSGQTPASMAFLLALPFTTTLAQPVAVDDSNLVWWSLLLGFLAPHLFSAAAATLQAQLSQHQLVASLLWSAAHPLLVSILQPMFASTMAPRPAAITLADVLGLQQEAAAEQQQLLQTNELLVLVALLVESIMTAAATGGSTTDGEDEEERPSTPPP